MYTMLAALGAVNWVDLALPLVFVALAVLNGLSKAIRKRIDAAQSEGPAEPSSPEPIAPARRERPRPPAAQPLPPRQAEILQQHAPGTLHPPKKPQQVRPPSPTVTARRSPQTSPQDAPQRRTPAQRIPAQHTGSEHVARAQGASIKRPVKRRKADLTKRHLRHLEPDVESAEGSSALGKLADRKKTVGTLAQRTNLADFSSKEEVPQIADRALEVHHPTVRDLRRAIVMNEILQPPLALRPPDPDF